MKTATLQIDRIRCDGHGVCAELLPERIRLDEWRYPISDAEPISGDLLPHARRAVSECPRQALRLLDAKHHSERSCQAVPQ